MTITPFWITGFEHQVVSPNGAGLFSSTTGLVSIETTLAHSGNASLKIAPIGSGSAANARKNLPASQQVLVLSGYIMFPSGGTPSANSVFFGCLSSTGSIFSGINISNAGVIRCMTGSGATTVASSITMADGQWYLIDMRISQAGTTWTVDWAIDGVAQTQVSAGSQTQGDISTIRMGTNTTAISMTGYIDDVIASIDSADYPIGAHGTQIILPASDGTHNAGTNVMENQAGTDIGAVSAYSLINDIPMSSATEYVRQAANGTGNYAEILFGDMTGSYGNILGAMALLAYTSATSSSNNGGYIVSDDDFSTWSAVYGEAGALVDYSDGNTADVYFKSVVIANPTILSEVNAMKARIGYSGDANPNPYWINIAIEVAYDYNHDATLTKTLDSLAITAEGTVAGGGGTIDGELTKTLDALTSSGVGTIEAKGDLSKTLDALTSSAAGTVETHGELNKTLDAVTSNGAGTVSISGSATPTLDALTSSAQGTVLNNGELAKTLNALTSTAEGAVSNNASLTKTLDDLALSGNGTVLNNGSLTQTLDALALSGQGTVLNNGELNKTLDALSISATGGAGGVDGSLNATLDNLTLSGVGTNENHGQLNQTLDSLSLSATGKVDIAGSLSKTLDDATSNGVGDVDIVGSLARTLGALSLLGEGVTPINGSLTKTLDTLQITAEGLVLSGNTGVLDSTLEGLLSSGAGTVFIQGTLSQVLDALQSSAQGQVIVLGALDKTLGDLTLVGTGTSLAQVIGELDKTLESLAVSAIGQIANNGSASITLDALTSSGVGDIDISGNLSKTLDGITINATGIVPVLGSLVGTFDALTSNANGGTSVSGALVVTLGELTLIGNDSGEINGSLVVVLGALIANAKGSKFIIPTYTTQAMIIQSVSSKTTLAQQKVGKAKTNMEVDKDGTYIGG